MDLKEGLERRMVNITARILCARGQAPRLIDENSHGIPAMVLDGGLKRCGMTSHITIS